MNKYGERGRADPQPAKLKGAREKNKYGELEHSAPQLPNLGGENGPDYAPEKAYNRRSRMASSSSAVG